ncbi:hypothetical protein BSKO_06071 [Bryopsis sp. KO-2023]|nr:hypothetical protein BSKO_06071 [Bryopsis sp. KO-2023]
MDEAQIEALYHSVRALSTRLFISPFTREDLSRALRSGHYESLLAQLLSCLVCIAERGDDWERAYEPGFSDVARPCLSQADFPPVVVVGYRAVKRLKKILDEKRFRCLESLARTDDRRKAPRTLLYDWRDKVAGVFSEENGLASGKVDFWDLRPENKLRFLQELLDAAISTARVREYLEMKVGGTHAFNEPGEDGSMERCVLCDLGGDLVCCDKCPRVFHSRCLNVSRRQLGTKDEDWVCPECKAEWKVDFDQPRLEVLGRGGKGEVFWLGDQCLMEGSEGAVDANLKIHRGEAMLEGWARIKEFSQNQTLLDKAEKLVEAARTVDRNPSSTNYINNYVDSHDPAAQTSLDRYLRRARQIAKKENAVRPNGLPARFRYRNGDGPEGFCKTYLLCIEKALAGLLSDPFWKTAGTWIEEVKRSRFPGECGRLLVELIQNLKDGMQLLDWASIEERPVGHQNRRDDDHLAEAYRPRKQPWWEYYRGRAAQDECLNRLPRNEAIRLARRGGLVEVEGVAYRLFQHVQKPVVAMRLQVLSMLEGCRSWSVLAEAVLMVDAVVNFDKFEADKNSTWLGASITNKATPEAGSSSSAAKYDVCGSPGSTEAPVELSVGEIPIWLVKRFEDRRRQEFDETLGRTLEKPALLQDPKECCGICGMKEPMWVRDSTQAVVDWICCDKCEQWYHQDCLMGSDQSMESRNDGSWVCGRCKEVKGRTKRTKRSQPSHQTPHSKQRKSLALAAGYPQPIPFLSPVILPGGMPNSRRRGWGVDPHFTDVFRKKRSPRVRKDGWGSTVEYALGIRPDSAEWRGVLEKGPPPPLVFHTPPPQPVVYSPVQDSPRAVSTGRRGRRSNGNRGRRGRGQKGGSGSARRATRRSQGGGTTDAETPLASERRAGGGLPLEEDPEAGVREVGGVRRKYRRVACGWIERILPQEDPAERLQIEEGEGLEPLDNGVQEIAEISQNDEGKHPSENGDEGAVAELPTKGDILDNGNGPSVSDGEKDEVPDSAEEEEREQREQSGFDRAPLPFGIGALCQSRNPAQRSSGAASDQSQEKNMPGMTTRSRIRSQAGAVLSTKPAVPTTSTPGHKTDDDMQNRTFNHQGYARTAPTDMRNPGAPQKDEQQPQPSSTNCVVREDGLGVDSDRLEGAQEPSPPQLNTIRKNHGNCAENGNDHGPQGDMAEQKKPSSPGGRQSNKCGVQTLRMTLRKRPRVCEDNGHAPEAVVRAKPESIPEEEQVPRAKRLARAAGWRKTAEGALERAQACQQWVKTTRSLKKKNGLAAIQSCLSSFLKPEDVVNRVQEVVSGWPLSSTKQGELLTLLKKQWQSRGLNWPTKRLREESNGDIVQSKAKKRTR